jgi:hypothetical protein
MSYGVGKNTENKLGSTLERLKQGKPLGADVISLKTSA